MLIVSVNDLGESADQRTGTAEGSDGGQAGGTADVVADSQSRKY